MTSGVGVVRSVERALAARGLLNPRRDEGSYRFRCTGDAAAFQQLGTRFLQMPLGEVVPVTSTWSGGSRTSQPSPALASLDGEWGLG